MCILRSLWCQLAALLKVHGKCTTSDQWNCRNFTLCADGIDVNTDFLVVATVVVVAVVVVVVVVIIAAGGEVDGQKYSDTDGNRQNEADDDRNQFLRLHDWMILNQRPVVDVIKLFWRKSGKSRFSPKLK